MKANIPLLILLASQSKAYGLKTSSLRGFAPDHRSLDNKNKNKNKSKYNCNKYKDDNEKYKECVKKAKKQRQKQEEERQRQKEMEEQMEDDDADDDENYYYYYYEATTSPSENANVAEDAGDTQDSEYAEDAGENTNDYEDTNMDTASASNNAGYYTKSTTEVDYVDSTTEEEYSDNMYTSTSNPSKGSITFASYIGFIGGFVALITLMATLSPTASAAEETRKKKSGSKMSLPGSRRSMMGSRTSVVNKSFRHESKANLAENEHPIAWYERHIVSSK